MSTPTTSADVLLTDGSMAAIRALEPTDRGSLEALHEGVSETSNRLRFFGGGRASGQHYVEHLFSREAAEIALVALVGGQVVAVATAEREDATSAEIAFLVADDHRGHGVGILLLEHLAAAGRDRGITRFTAEVLTENVAMAAVFRAAGFEVERTASHGVTVVAMSTVASARAVSAADARECLSEARSLEPLSRPRSVAIVGVSRTGTGIGAAILNSILEGGFTGEVVVVHPRQHEVAGLRAYPRLVDVPGRIDIAVVAVPARRVMAVMADAVAAGVALVVVVSSGFADVGPAGAVLQHELVQLAREAGIRLIGPNGLGVQVNDPEVRLNATFSDLVPRAGGFALASQSGGVGVALLDVAVRTGLGVRTFVSLGNKADVSGNDLLAAWMDDPEVTAAGLYLESFGNAPKFARMARRFSERKPLMVMLGGSSVSGGRGGASHTGAAATSPVAAEAMFGYSGVIPCHNVEEMAQAALVFAEQPLPRGRRTAVITNAGGMGILACDAADEVGLVVPALSSALQRRLRKRAPDLAGTANPVDLGAGATPVTLAAAVGEVLASGEVDALLVVLVATRVGDPARLVQTLVDARTSEPELPVTLVVIGAPVPESATPGVSVLPTITAAIRALTQVSRYAAWLEVPRNDPAPTNLARAIEARSWAGRHLDGGAAPEGWLEPALVTTLLAPYGAGPLGTVAFGAVGVAAAAEKVGFPVAVKVVAPHVVHKTDRGLVRIDLTTPAAVMDTVRAFEAELEPTPVGVLVQPVCTGVEMALGLVHDPTFGPLVMVAAGGTATDLLADRVFLLPPLDAGSVARAVRSLRSWPLLDGYRGAPRVDVAALERLILALGELGTDVPEVAELDLNPVLVGVDGVHLVDVKVRVARASTIDAGVPRRLRAPR